MDNIKTDNNIKSLQHFTIICNTKDTDKMVKMLSENGAHCISIRYGHGSVKQGYFAQALGLEIESKKAIITSLMLTEKATEVIEILRTKYDFTKANTGIAYGVPVQGLLF